jgi:hypothetical protein
MAFAALVIMASVPLFGGSLSRVTGVRLRHGWLLFVALVLQMLISNVLTGVPRALPVTLHLISYGLAAVALWVNRALPGLVVIGAGAALNGVVIGLNGGTLPASAHALREAGLGAGPTDFVNSGVLPHPILPWLGDMWATPSWLPFPNVISIGDITVLIGAAILVHVVAHRQAIAPTPAAEPETRLTAVASLVPVPRTGSGSVVSPTSPSQVCSSRDAVST